MLDILARQVASPVQFVKGLRDALRRRARASSSRSGRRGRCRASPTTCSATTDVADALFTNHPKVPATSSRSTRRCAASTPPGSGSAASRRTAADGALEPGATAQAIPAASPPAVRPRRAGARGCRRTPRARARPPVRRVPRARPRADRARPSAGRAPTEPVVITGAGARAPGHRALFDDANVGRLLDGEQFIDVIPGAAAPRDPRQAHHAAREERRRQRALRDDRPRRRRASSSPRAAGRVRPRRGVRRRRRPDRGARPRHPAGDRRRASTRCATPASRSCMRYNTTTKGTQLPDRWSAARRAARRHRRHLRLGLPRPRRDGLATADALHARTAMRRERLAALEALRARMLDHGGHGPRSSCDEVDRRIHDRRAASSSTSRTSSTAASCSACSRWATRSSPSCIGARGPNTQINSACASTTQAVAIAEDWIRAGRCRRVVIVAADDVTSRHDAAVDRRRLPGLRAPRRPTRSSRTRRCRSTGAATA